MGKDFQYTDEEVAAEFMKAGPGSVILADPRVFWAGSYLGDEYILTLSSDDLNWSFNPMMQLWESELERFVNLPDQYRGLYSQAITALKSMDETEITELSRHFPFEIHGVAVRSFIGLMLLLTVEAASRGHLLVYSLSSGKTREYFREWFAGFLDNEFTQHYCRDGLKWADLVKYRCVLIDQGHSGAGHWMYTGLVRWLSSPLFDARHRVVLCNQARGSVWR